MPRDLDTDLHFTCFVEAPSGEYRAPGVPPTPTTKGRIIELDGRRNGPVDRGECNDLLLVSRAASNAKHIMLTGSSLYIGCCENSETGLYRTIIEHAL